MINLNNCKEGDRLKNRAGYDCTYSYKADNKHIVRLLNLTSYYVDDHGFVANGSPQYMDDITEIVKIIPKVTLFQNLNLNSCTAGDMFRSRGGFYSKYSHKAGDDRHVLVSGTLFKDPYVVNDYGFVKSDCNCPGDVVTILTKQKVTSSIFDNLPEGVTELVHNGKRYIKRTVTKTQWEEVL